MAVTTETIAIALGLTTPTSGSATERQWGMWIKDAKRLIEKRRISLGVDELDRDDFDYVVREAVVEQVRHPDNATQVTVAVDDGSSTRRYESGTGRVSIRAEWWTMLGLEDEDDATAFAITLAPGHTIPTEVSEW